tara:strand:+ start:7314 stop:8693 length:1380 start_codon:yes stop_codon:yes gene_type:complete
MLAVFQNGEKTWHQRFSSAEHVVTFIKRQQKSGKRIRLISVVRIQQPASQPTSKPGGYRKTQDKPVRLTKNSSHGLPVGTPDSVGLRVDAVRRMVEKARSESSSALVLIKDGKLVVEEYFGKKATPIMAMSVSKSFVSLAIGLLWKQGKIKSLDMKMSDVFKEWRGTPKKDITLYQMLTHTSGLHHARTLGKRVKGKWVLGHISDGLKGRLVSKPGDVFRYNNRAIDLLALFVGRISGKSLDVYLQEHLFSKLGIRSVSWMKDAAGVPRGAGEMSILPVDLAKIGLLMLQKGVWRGQQIVPTSWVKRSWRASKKSSHCGLLWWRRARLYDYILTENILKQWRVRGVDKVFLAKLKPLLHKRMGLVAYRKAINTALGGNKTANKQIKMALQRGAKFGAMSPKSHLMFAAQGWLGQYLVIDTTHKLVGVRMRRAVRDDYRRRPSKHTYRSFIKDMFSLAGH